MHEKQPSLLHRVTNFVQIMGRLTRVRIYDFVVIPFYGKWYFDISLSLIPFCNLYKTEFSGDLFTALNVHWKLQTYRCAHNMIADILDSNLWWCHAMGTLSHSWPTDEESCGHRWIPLTQCGKRGDLMLSLLCWIAQIYSHLARDKFSIIVGFVCFVNPYFQGNFLVNENPGW